MKKEWTRNILAILITIVAFTIYGCTFQVRPLVAEEDTTEISSVSAGTLEVHYIDVGQGDATLLICDGEAMLIDAGDNDSGTTVQKYLQDCGVTELKYVVGTHPDADHIGGLDVILTKFAVLSNEVWMPEKENDTYTYRDVLDTIEYMGYKKTCPETGSSYPLGAATITLIPPINDYEGTNNSSIVVLAQYGFNRFLFVGDAEAEEEEDMIYGGIDISADVLKVSHHGSGGATTQDLLDTVNPTYAVISCGQRNEYGHPHGSLLNRLRENGIEVFRTDEQGSIQAVADGITIQWNCSPSTTWKAGEWE